MPLVLPQVARREAFLGSGEVHYLRVILVFGNSKVVAWSAGWSPMLFSKNQSFSREIVGLVFLGLMEALALEFLFCLQLQSYTSAVCYIALQQKSYR